PRPVVAPEPRRQNPHMSSHHGVDPRTDGPRRHRAERKPRLRVVLTGAAAIAVLGGGTAFACMGGSGHPSAKGPAHQQAAPVTGGHPAPTPKSSQPSAHHIPGGSPT